VQGERGKKSRNKLKLIMRCGERKKKSCDAIKNN
jgi:hypothetical protein